MTRTELMLNRSHLLARAIGGVLLVAIVLVSIASGVFLAIGGRFHHIETPSMGTYAPVGSLVLSLPASYDDMKVGQPAFFNPPGGKELYFHRLAGKTTNGFVTRGDLNQVNDPWVLGKDNIVGREVLNVRYLGWLLPVLPILIVGGLVIHIYTRFFVERYWRFPLQVVGWSLVLSLANFLLQPLLRAVFLSQVVKDHKAEINLVSTGILPMDVTAVNGESAVARLGEIVRLHTNKVAANNKFEVVAAVHLEWWQWIIAIAIIILPFMLCLGYVVVARKYGWDYYYEEIAPEDVPEDVVVNESDPVLVRGKLAPAYVQLEELLAEAGLDVDAHVDGARHHKTGRFQRGK